MATTVQADVMDVVRILPDVLFRCHKGPDGKIYWSLNEGGLAEEFGLTTEAIRGKSLDELFPGGASDALHEHFELAFQGTPTIFTNEMQGRHFRHYPQPLRDADGNVTEVVGYIADVTDLVEKERALARANRELDAFSYRVSHDLRNPISSLGLYVDILARQCGPESDEVLERLRRLKATMEGMVEDYLDLSRARNRPVKRVPIDVSQEARQVQAMVDPAGEQSWEIPDGLHAVADPVLLRMVLQNLFSNAVKYRDGPGRIRLDHDAVGAFVVEDDGLGFPQEKSETIFEAFERLEPERPGTGVGLSTVRAAIEHLGGSVWAESEPGHGSRFYFTLEAA